MNGSGVVGSWERSRVLNAVPLRNAVLCAECDVVSDSPHDVCNGLRQPFFIQCCSSFWREPSEEEGNPNYAATGRSAT